MSFFPQDELAAPCSVSQEFVDYVASLHPELLLDKSGQPIIPRVLFMLGFHINIDKPFNDIYITLNMRIRSVARPYETYLTTVYNGRTRKYVDKFEDGKVVYSKFDNHQLRRLYETVEVVTIGHISKDLLSDINTIGDITAYNNGMANMNKQVDPDKPIRHIVR